MYRVLLTRGNKAYAIECDNEFNEYSSCHEAALAVNGSEDSISACCRGINKTSKNFKWKYKE